MKPYQDLTRRGRLRRARALARRALEHYDLRDPQITFQHYSGNIVYRVDAQGTTGLNDDDGIFVPNRYNLRVLTSSDIDLIRSELVWLRDLRRGTGMAVQEPVPTLAGELAVRVAPPGISEGKVVNLLRWVDGKHLNKGLTSKHARNWGRMMAKLHRFSAGWTPPEGFKRDTWNWEGLLGPGVLRTPIEELVAMMPEKYRGPFTYVSDQIRKVMTGLGAGSEAFGLIHADMYLENLLFKGTEPRPIDFEDCGFGYWLYDIAIPLSAFRWDENMQWVKDVFLDGYLAERSLPNEQLKHLDLFMACRYADFTLWGTAFIQHDPGMAEEHTAWRDESGDLLVNYIESL
jgi:Ser/Thr protein kinase RdoA (MazF antagonist)